MCIPLFVAIDISIDIYKEGKELKKAEQDKLFKNLVREVIEEYNK